MQLSSEIMRIFQRQVDRRSLLKAGMLAIGGCIFPCTAFGAFEKKLTLDRSLYLYNLHTGESLKTVYWSRGKYISEALVDINYILRDHRTGEIESIDKRLLDLLYAISKRLGTQDPFKIISGYRSPSTNAILCKRSSGVAKGSLHQKGKAADIRVPGCELSLLRNTALALKGGGVGFYPKSNFVHVDVGRVRYW
jgi:uncharacterized protein YcbK (DUF882 family)